MSDQYLTITPPLSEPHRAYLERFIQMRHIRRDWITVAGGDDPLRQAAGLPPGYEGAYHTGLPELGVIDSNRPAGQPAPGWVRDSRPLRLAEIEALEARWKANKVLVLLGYRTIGEPCDEPGSHAEHGDCVLGWTTLGSPNPDDEQPGFWCPWRIEGDDRLTLTATPLRPADWLRYLIDHFLEPWGYEVDGAVTYGEQTIPYGTVVAAGVGVYEEEYS